MRWIHETDHCMIERAREQLGLNQSRVGARPQGQFRRAAHGGGSLRIFGDVDPYKAILFSEMIFADMDLGGLHTFTTHQRGDQSALS